MITKENILELKIRKKIYDFIEENPSLHLREIQRRTNIPITTLRYHLRYLKKIELVIEKSEGGCIRYHIINKISLNDKNLLNLLRNKTVRLIIISFFVDVVTSRIKISKLLDIHPNTIDFYLKKLLSLGIIEPAEVRNNRVISAVGTIIECTPTGREKSYRLKNVRAVWDVMFTYQKSFLDDFTEEMLIELYMGNRKMPKKLRPFKLKIDSAVEFYLEICPVPFCA